MKRMNMITMKRVVARSLTDTSTIGSSSPSFLRSLSSASSTTADVDVASSVAKLVTPTFLQPRVVLYDGVCHLCHRGVKWVIRADKDKKIKFCCVQSNAAEPYLRASGLEREDVLRRFLFIEGLNVFSQGSTGAKVQIIEKTKVHKFIAVLFEPRKGAISLMSAMWLIPQLTLAGFSYAFTLVGQVEF